MNTNPAVTEPFTAPFLSSSFWQLWRESVSNPEIFVQRDGGVNSTRNSFQAVVTQAEARGHCPPNPCVALLAENEPHGVTCAQTLERPLGWKEKDRAVPWD